ncbi:MAG: J domain-containing protein [Rhodomicrobium sp.]
MQKSSEALSAALAMLHDPRLVRAVRDRPLPKGITLLLETAAGEAGALAGAAAVTGRSEATLKNAAGFFIEQVLLSPGADSYRILGADRETTEGELRRHMALLMRWVHPDLVANGAAGQSFDRSVYASRVAQAWQKIKSPERRAAYEASQATASGQRPKERRSGQMLVNPKSGRQRQLKIYRLQGEGIWNRLLLLFAGWR